MEFSYVIEIEAPPNVVWNILRDVERWREWTTSISDIQRLDEGPLVVGRRVRIRQPRLLPAVWTVTELEEGRSFTWVTSSPGVRVAGGHWIEPHGTGCRVTLRATFTGLLGPLIGRITKGLNETYIALEANGLKARGEST